MTVKPRFSDGFQSLSSATRLRSIGPKLVLSLLIAVGFFWLLRRGALPMLPPTAAWGGVAWWGVARTRC